MAESQPSRVVKELRAAYLKSLAVKMTELAEALKARQFSAIVRLGHQLKGSGRSYGLPEISDLGARMEEAAENRRLTVLEPLLAEFEATMNHVADDQPTSEKS
ncbi:MAG TPA: Hpt domain-containing protein [bacterium]|jgi:HPt (histidine-containing phosphotransfer) domain-containing protein